MEFTGDYYLGLDMGTNSVGWAVTDTNYHLVRKSGKDLWGIREFDEAKTSAERRMHRISRRGRQREEARIGLLKSYFSDAIETVDKYFYPRLENSKYFPEDKEESVKGPNGIFNDPDFKDKDYFTKYPTIFHLRKALIENSEAPYDVRLIFLAILNMFKHRGHFLNEGLSSDGQENSMQAAYSSFIEYAEREFDITFPSGIAGEIETILADKKISRTGKYEKLAEICSVDKKDKKRTVKCSLCQGHF